MSKRARLTPRQKDYIWHTIKAILCAVVLGFCVPAARTAVGQSVSNPTTEQRQIPFLWLLAVLTQVLIYLAIQRYFNKNDDYAFDRFCEPETCPELLRERPYQVALGITTASAAVLLWPGMGSLVRAIFPGMIPVVSQLIALPVVLGIAFLVPFWDLRSLSYVWSVQKSLRRPTDKPMGQIKRALLAAVFCVAMWMVSVLGPVFAIMFAAFIPAIYTVAKVPVFLLAVALVIFRIIRFVGRIRDRKKFIARLQSLQEKGELTYTVHGHPYLSLFSRRVEYALTITDNPHPEAKRPEIITYKVAIANCNRRRMTVVLCPDNVFQFVYSFKIRAIGSIGTIGMGNTSLINIPLLSIFRSHSFDFPEGEGKRILLVDPAPHTLCMRGFREGEFITLDNASEQFGYTVFGKHAFLTLLERI